MSHTKLDLLGRIFYLHEQMSVLLCLHMPFMSPHPITPILSCLFMYFTSAICKHEMNTSFKYMGRGEEYEPVNLKDNVLRNSHKLVLCACVMTGKHVVLIRFVLGSLLTHTYSHAHPELHNR